MESILFNSEATRKLLRGKLFFQNKILKQPNFARSIKSRSCPLPVATHETSPNRGDLFLFCHFLVQNFKIFNPPPYLFIKIAIWAVFKLPFGMIFFISLDQIILLKIIF